MNHHHNCSSCGRTLPGHRKPKAKTCGRRVCQQLLRTSIKDKDLRLARALRPSGDRGG